MALSLNRGCPVGDGTALDLGFRIKARTTAASLAWRRAAASFDAMFPSSGTVLADGNTDVSLQDVVLGDEVAFEVTDGSDHVVLRFAVKHR